MTDSGKAIFLSYAHEDVVPARRIADALRAAGIEVWFDQSELRGGDAWDAKIKSQIRDCTLFVPVISAHTQARTEGYFRREWRLAVERMHDMADDAQFLVPVVIDDTPDAKARVPERFHERQWTRLRDGEATEAFCAQIKSLLAGSGDFGADSPPTPLARTHGGSRGEATPPPSKSPITRTANRTPRDVGPALAAGPSDDENSNGGGPPASGGPTLKVWSVAAIGLIAVAVVLFQLRPTAPSAAGKKSPEPSDAVQTTQREAAALVVKAREQLNRPELYRAELEIADDLCKRATTLDPDSADAWATWSHVDSWTIYHSLDVAEARRESARAKASRALKLDPKSFEARFAEANYLVRGTPGSAMGAAPTFAADVLSRLRELLKDRPNEPRIWFALGIAQRNVRNFVEATQAFDRVGATPAFVAIAWSEKGWMFAQKKDYAAALTACNESVALHPFRGNLLLRILLSLVWTGDLELAKATLARVPSQLLQEDDFAGYAARVHWWRREPGEMRRVLNVVPRAWIAWGASAPKSYFLGESQRMLGEEEAAQAAWREALPVIDDQLAKAPNSARLLFRKVRLLGLLGRIDEGNALLGLARASGIAPEPLTTAEFSDWSVALALGDRTAALSELEKGYEVVPAWSATWAMLRHSPLLDPLRNEPRFKALLARAEADPERCPHAKKQAGTTTPAPNAKSVAVLAFKNLSEVRDDDVFSDGISDELTNVLGRVPGLRVAGSTSAFSFKGKAATVQEIGRTLGVDYVVDGTVRKANGRVRISAKLLNATDGFQIWVSENMERELKDIWAVQDELVGLIAQNLSLKLGTTLRRSRPVDPEAHRLLLEGLHFWRSRKPDDFVRAEERFLAALKIDPQFAEAHANLSLCRGSLAAFQSHEMPEIGALVAGAKQAAEAALALDATLIPAQSELAWVHFLQGQLGPAAEAFQRVLRAKPDDAYALHFHSYVQSEMGRLDLALESSERAVRNDPLQPQYLQHRAQLLLFARRYAEALKVVQRSLDLRPDFLASRTTQARCLRALGRTEEAIQIARSIQRDPQATLRFGSDASAIEILLSAGLRDEGREYASEVMARLRPGSPARRTLLLALGRWDEVLDDANALYDPFGGRECYWSDLWDPVRNDPRFPKVVAQYQRTEYYQTARETLARLVAEDQRK